VDLSRYRQLAEQMERGPWRRRLVWVAIQNRRQLLAFIRSGRREGRTWPDDPSHPVRHEATDWHALANYGRYLEATQGQRPMQGDLFAKEVA
jgi:hypothetical protein